MFAAHIPCQSNDPTRDPSDDFGRLQPSLNMWVNQRILGSPRVGVHSYVFVEATATGIIRALRVDIQVSGTDGSGDSGRVQAAVDLCYNPVTRRLEG